MLRENTIEIIKRKAFENRLSQAVIIEKAIETYCGNKRTESSGQANDTTINILRGELEFKNHELEKRDQQIDKLIEAQHQSNHLLAIFKKDDVLIEHQEKELKKEQVETRHAVSNQNKKTTKKKKNKGKKKK